MKQKVLRLKILHGKILHLNATSGNVGALCVQAQTFFICFAALGCTVATLYIAMLRWAQSMLFVYTSQEKAEARMSSERNVTPNLLFKDLDGLYVSSFLNEDTVRSALSYKPR